METIHPTHYRVHHCFFQTRAFMGRINHCPTCLLLRAGTGRGETRQNRARPGFDDSQPRPRGSGPRIRGHEDSRPCIAPTRMDPGMSAD